MTLIPSLHVMTEYSLLESAIRVDDLIAFATTKKLTSLVITDHNNMFGVAEFIHKCRQKHIRPIIGLDLDVANFRLILLARNYAGFLELIKLSSKKNYGLEIEIADIDGANLVIIDHPEFGHHKTSGSELNLSNLFTTSNPAHDNYVHVTYTRFISDDDKNTIKIIDSLKTGKMQQNGLGCSYKPIDKSCSTYDQIKTIINSCDIDFPTHSNPIPQFDKKHDSRILFRNLINHNAPLILEDKLHHKSYIARLKEEIQIIEKLKYEDYFLIIHDLIKWSRENKILIGPGRGSSAGSLVSYILNITEIDPIVHGLLFERFLNPERITMPDIDIDIQDNKRDHVIRYLIEKYGAGHVGLISTFQRLAAKGALREVGRMMEIPTSDVLAITKLVPYDLNLNEAFTQVPRFRAAINNEEKYLTLFKNAQKIEGLPKNLGTHAAGIVIANNPLKSFVPITKSAEGYTQVQYSMNHLVENGLLKIDLLGLRNLTILEDIQMEIYKNHKRKILLSHIPLNDQRTNKLLSIGNTNGIFQLESYGMKKTLSQVGISSLDDLVAVIALFRPGPMDFIATYANVKNHKQPQKFINKEYDAIVKSTYGIMVYQEQIMQIVQKYASMSFGKADVLRRAIGKKNKALIASLKNEFVKGSINNGHTTQEALNIFFLIEKFADYGFNKAHAVSYALLGYRMAYLKAWFPFEFYTALINSAINSPSTLKQYINEAKRANISIVAPKINISQLRIFNKKPYIYLPLAVIKGVGGVANFKIMNERDSNGPYQDFCDFVARCRKNTINEIIILAIIKANALSAWGNMTSLTNSLPQALRYAAMITKTIDGVKTLDFEMLEKPSLINMEAKIDAEVKWESETIGFNISLFKTMPYEGDAKIIDVARRRKAQVIARILKNKAFQDKNNNTMGIVLLEDSSMEVEAFAFSEVYKFIAKSKKDQIVKVWLEYKNSRYIITANWEVLDEK